MTKQKIVFMDGCFDSFEGTQEELNELVESIKSMIEDGSIMSEAVPLSLEESNEIREMFASKRNVQ